MRQTIKQAQISPVFAAFFKFKGCADRMPRRALSQAWAGFSSHGYSASGRPPKDDVRALALFNGTRRISYARNFGAVHGCLF
jgi:hypothetical protein